MQAGKLRTQVTIETRVEGSPSRSPTGQPLWTWGTHAVVPASIEPIMGQSYFAAQMAGSKIDTRIRIRYEVGVTDDVDNTMRVSANGVIYDINAVIDVDYRQRELVLMCTSGQNLG